MGGQHLLWFVILGKIYDLKIVGSLVFSCFGAISLITDRLQQGDPWSNKMYSKFKFSTNLNHLKYLMRMWWSGPYKKSRHMEWVRRHLYFLLSTSGGWGRERGWVGASINQYMTQSSRFRVVHHPVAHLRREFKHVLFCQKTHTNAQVTVQLGSISILNVPHFF